MLKAGIRTVQRGPLQYTLGADGRPTRLRPWLGDIVSPFYDAIMRRSVFPKKFLADIDRHVAILREALSDVHGQRVLELGTGSGSATAFLPADNRYVGSDVSPSLLRQAAKRFQRAGFSGSAFYVAGAESLPFANDTFDLCLCIISLNFFGETAPVLSDIQRMLVPGGRLLCAVPVPERSPHGSVIHGTLHSEAELDQLCADQGLALAAFPDQNGALLYFWAEDQ